MPAPLKNNLVKTYAPNNAKPRGIVMNVTFTAPLFNRISKMKHAKSLNFDQDIVRIATVEYLERNGF